VKSGTELLTSLPGILLETKSKTKSEKIDSVTLLNENSYQ